MRIDRSLSFFLAVVALVGFLGSCATGGGSGFAREASKERAAHSKKSSKDKDQDEEEEESIPQITVVASPSNARISLNGRFAGTGTVSFDSLGFGQKVEISVEAPSHRPATRTVELWGQDTTVRIDLEPILGTLELLGDNPGAQYFLEGKTLASGANRVLIGDYTLTARRFGYVDQTHRVTILEDQTTSVPLTFLPAAFDLTGLKSDRPDGFNPESASIAASTKLTFEASAPGHALLLLKNRKGLEVARWDFPRLTTWNQEAEWDGRFDGEPLPTGSYTLTLTGGPSEGTDTVSRTIKVRIDQSLIDNHRASLGPAAGLLWTPTAEVLGPGTVQASVLGLGHVEEAGAHFPVSTALRFSPARGWEGFGQLSARIWGDYHLNSGYATFSVKRRIALDSPDFRAAWVVGGTVGTWLVDGLGIPPTDFLTTFPAVRALLPAAWSWGKWTILVAPEIDGSFWSPTTAYESSSVDAIGFRLWGYGRVGLSYDPGPFSFALSGAARTRSFDQGTGWLAPAHLGLEGHYPIPDSPLTLSGYLSVSAYNSVDYAWYGGIGLSVLLPPNFTLDVVSQLQDSL